MSPLRILDKGARLVVRVTPNASRDAIAGVVNDVNGRPMLAVRVAAPAVDGAANAALIAFLAKTLRIRRSCITLTAGESSRIKQLQIEGDGAAIAQDIDRLISAA